MEVPDLGEYRDRDWPEPQRGHAAMITRMDRDLGRLLALLKELKVDKNTVVFFSSDNGPHREGGNDPDFNKSSGLLRGIKRSLHEGGIRVPLIVRWPGRIAAGSQSDWIGGFQDVLPTLADLAGVSVPAGLDGISFRPTLVSAPSQPDHDHLYWAFYEQGGARAVRAAEWKVVQQPYRSPVRLYNLAEDLGERRDVATQHPDIVKRLTQLMDQAYTPSPRWRFSSRPAVEIDRPLPIPSRATARFRLD
jgi:uncharacterized sulfatase